MQTLRRLGYLALGIGFAQVVFGAIVRITGSGMGCGDNWPDCFGSLTPVNSGASLLIEISHRYGAAALTVAIIAMMGVALRKRAEPGVGGRGGVLRAALLAVVLVIVAAIFGAVTVKMSLRPIIVVTHLLIAMALLAVLTIAVVRAGGLGGNSAIAAPTPLARTRRSAIVAAALTFTALVFGALTANIPGAPVACTGFPWCREMVAGAPLGIQITHRIVAFLLLGHLIGIVVGVRRRGEAGAIRTAALVSLGLVVVQVLVAAAMVEMHLPPALRSIHQAVGTMLWIAVVTLAALASGEGGRAEIADIVRESPSRGTFATPEGVST